MEGFNLGDEVIILDRESLAEEPDLIEYIGDKGIVVESYGKTYEVKFDNANQYTFYQNELSLANKYDEEKSRLNI